MLLAAVLCVTPGVTPATARTLTVGPGEEFTVPSEAAAAAQDGDIVQIGAGTFYDCAIWHARRLTIQGQGADTVISDTACQGKAIFILGGDGATIRDLTLARARVADGNGAGIRLEAQSLTLQNLRFINDEVGLLAGAPGPGRIVISDCLFEAGGVGGDRPLFAVLTGAVALLQVEHSTIRGVRGGGISSAAEHTVLDGNDIATGTGQGPGPAVQASGGRLTMRDNLITLGPMAWRRRAAVLALGSGEVVLQRNRLANATGRPAILVLNWGSGATTLEGNQLADGDTEASTSGIWRHRAATLAHQAIGQARHLAGGMMHGLQPLLGR